MAVHIATLPDLDAVIALRLVLHRLGLASDMETLRAVQVGLPAALERREALPGVPPDPAPTAGTLARATLALLAEDPTSRDAALWAVEEARAEQAERDGLTVVVGALVVIALRTEVLIERHPKKGVTIRFHLKPISDPLLRNVFSQLLGLFSAAPPGQDAPPPELPQ
ncbi:hypothetical protein ACIA98_34805 [Streptomyces sp. NPDC051366]|uniref:hypothetical protein n=1 Tax=Streptomyces sp. NPDC051366 TaxID=3365652 RepID=UPI0037921526